MEIKTFAFAAVIISASVIVIMMLIEEFAQWNWERKVRKEKRKNG